MRTIYRGSFFNPIYWPWGHILETCFKALTVCVVVSLAVESYHIFKYLPYFIVGVTIGSIINQPIQGDVREVEIEFVEEEGMVNNQPIIVRVPCKTILQIYNKGEWVDIIGSEKDV